MRRISFVVIYLWKELVFDAYVPSDVSVCVVRLAGNMEVYVDDFTAFCDFTPYSVTDNYQYFGGICYYLLPLY
jgi:hypothetical protein